MPIVQAPGGRITCAEPTPPTTGTNSGASAETCTLHPGCPCGASELIGIGVICVSPRTAIANEIAGRLPAVTVQVWPDHGRL